jgi:thiamine biosynthesis protein ThiI
MSSPDKQLVMARLAGELATKGRRTRRRFQRKLVANLRDAYRAAGADVTIREEWSRLYLETDKSIEEMPLTNVFGLSSWSRIDAVVAADIDSIVHAGRDLYSDRVAGRSYAVRARRSGLHSFNSADVMQQLGAALNPGATVNLTAPDVEVFVEVRDHEAYLFADRVKGAGGLPLGLESRAVSLLSGGFDSAVSSWQLLKRGVALDYVFCNLGGDAYRRMVLEVAKQLADNWSYGTRPRLYTVDFSAVVEHLKAVVGGSYLQVALKRQMYRAAEAIAAGTRADAIVTGEAIGQVSSQTLANLRAIDAAVQLPVLRPLVGYDKEEIIGLARQIGTYDLSARVREYCSISEGRTATGARSSTLDREESGLDASVLESAISNAVDVDLRGLRMDSVIAAGLFTDQVPDGALIIDLSTDDGEASAAIGAIRLAAEDLDAGFSRFDRSRPVVLVCPQGMVSAQIAERMQREGFEAYSLRGGTRRLSALHTANEESR